MGRLGAATDGARRGLVLLLAALPLAAAPTDSLAHGDGEEPADGQEAQQEEVTEDGDPAVGELVVEERRADVRLLPGATVTSFSVADDAPRVLDLGDLLSAAPGTHVRRTGGVGASQFAQLRGAGAGQVRILVDGVPLPQDSRGAADLASLPLDDVERIEVYRGSLPLALGGEGVAGAINLVTRRPQGRSLQLAGAVGSFHTFEGSAGVSGARGPWRGRLWLGGRSSDNDFAYYDDNGTPYTGADDEPAAIRENADTRRAELSMSAMREGDLELRTGADILLREAGVPGPAAYQISDARLAERRAAGDLRLAGGQRLRRELGLALQADRQRFQDSLDQVELLPPQQRSDSASLALDGLADWEVQADKRITAATRFSHEALNSGEETVSEAQRVRQRAGLSAELSGRWSRLGLGARFNADWARTRAQGVLPYSLEGVPQASRSFLASPATSVSLRLTSFASLRLSGGLAHRLPTFPELYGDPGGVLGNEDLSPEHGLNLDAGADLAGPWCGGIATLSLTGYRRDLRDMIAYVQNSQFFLRAENFERMVVQGLEAEADWTLPVGREGNLELGAAYSLTLSRNMTSDPVSAGKELPGQPRHELFADLEGGLDALWLGASLEQKGRAYRDSANLQVMPARVFFHARAGWRFFPNRDASPRFTLEVRNLLDKRVEELEVADLSSGEPALQALCDYGGYPLPGRAFFLSVAWDRSE